MTHELDAIGLAGRPKSHWEQRRWAPKARGRKGVRTLWSGPEQIGALPIQ